jgi:hypothetical protein
MHTFVSGLSSQIEALAIPDDGLLWVDSRHMRVMQRMTATSLKLPLDPAKRESSSDWVRSVRLGCRMTAVADT